LLYNVIFSGTFNSLYIVATFYPSISIFMFQEIFLFLFIWVYFFYS